MSSDHNKPSDRAVETPTDTTPAQRGLDRIDNLLDEELEQPEGADLPITTDTTAGITETDHTTDLDETNEQPDSVEQPATTLADDGSHEQPPIAPESSQKIQSRRCMLEAGLIAVPLIFSAASSEAQIIEARQRAEQQQPAITQMAEGQHCEIKHAPVADKSAGHDPNIELLADAHDLGQQRRIEEDTAGRTEEPTTSAGDGAPPA